MPSGADDVKAALFSSKSLIVIHTKTGQVANYVA